METPTSDDYTTWWATARPGQPTPDVPLDLLRQAALMLDTYLDHHAPTGTEKALTNAACAQATYWHKTGLNPETVSTGQQVASMSLMDGSVTYADAAHTRAALEKAVTTPCSEARRYLRAAGISRPPLTVLG